MKNYILWFFAWSSIIISDGVLAAYYGKSLGKLSEFHHGVSGHVYAVDGRTLFIKDFTYDGEGPAAFFYVGTSKSPNNVGAQRLKDERGSAGVLRRYRGRDITLTLPEGKTFNSIRWFSVWCDEFSVNFGDVKIPKNLDFPKPQKISGLSGVHGVSSDPIVIVDAQTLLIPNFSYDGEAPDAKFWVGRGDKPSPQGIRIPDENGKVTPLRIYDHKTIVLTMPADLTIFDIGHFGVWCEAFTVDFGHIRIPEVINVPPSLKMLGVSPQSKLNCEVLYDDLAFEVRWAVAGESVVVQLVAKLEDGEYMSFGISGDDSHSQMVGSDVTVAWVDKSTLKGYAFDYYLDAKSQCAGTRGSCPDERIADKTNSVRLLNAAMVNGYSIVTYQRPLKAADELDRAVLSDKPQPVVWAIGPLNSRKEVSYHTHFTKSDRFLDFGRPPTWNCPMPEMDDVGSEEVKKQSGGKTTSTNNGQFLVETTNSGSNRGKNKFASDEADSDISETTGYKEQATRGGSLGSRPVPTPKPAPKGNAWEIPAINCNEPEDGVFYAQMGPTGGKQGYPAITGHVGWGISWYINGLLIPEINVVRGKTYTFVVEAGEDENVPAKYHPFYITDDSVGGYQHRTPEERANINIYAGVRKNRKGDVFPEGVGRSCYWTPDSSGPSADEFPSFGAYQRTLTLKCDVGEPGVVTWTPDRNTPDTVYYQCFTHRYLGWRINVLDSCDDYAQASEKHEIFESPDEDIAASGDLLSRPSIRVATRIRPDNNFLLEQQRESFKIQGIKQGTKNIENHNLSGPNDSRVNIREIGRKPHNNDVIIGESIVNTFAADSKNVSPESNPRPDYDFPITKNQFKQVLDSVENYESNMRNQQDERHPVYHHTSSPNQKDGNVNPIDQDRPLRNNEEFLMEMKNAQNQMGMPGNQKPMTLQTFMRPHGKPMMGNNMFFRRPTTLDMRIRRPGMQKPIIGMPPRLPPPPPFMMGQPNFMSSHKKPIYKMPGMMNRPQMNGFGRPPINMPNKHSINNGMNVKPLYPGGQTTVKSPTQSIILGKPNLMSQTLTLGQPTIIGQQIVRSQMTLPSGGDNIPQQTQQNLPPTYLNKPGQIIMGKPMDSPMPLDQQMIQTKQHVSFSNIHFSTPKPMSNKVEIVKPVYEVETTPKGSNGIQIITPSELINNSSFTTESQVTMRPAVNTGFKPDSVVIEGGFKPIIREPLLSGEDRITDYDSDSVTNNRRVDEDTSGPERENEGTNQLLNNEFYEKQLTESFEPMFIPSPPDRHMQIKNITIPRGENKGMQYVDIRPRPVYIKSSEKDSDSSKESDKSSAKKQNDDMAMAADRVDAYYLPPEHKSKPLTNHPVAVDLPAGTVVSYDGHKVSDSTLTTPSQKNALGKIYSAKVSSNSEQLTKTPQFGPFKGEIPSALEGQLGSRPVTKLKSVSNSHSYPGSLGSSFSPKDKSTHLSLISALFGDDETKSILGDLEYEASENKEEVSDDEDDSNDEIESDDDSNDRVKRSAHHTPDHTDYPALNGSMPEDDTVHDHSMHDHSMHDHSMHDHSMHDHSMHNHSDHDHSMHSHGDLLKVSAAVTNTFSLQCMVLMPLCALLSRKFI